jgi:predicted GIY-YIG superfamily endonuclease
MSAKRDTYRYKLKDGNRVVYIGITNEPERRVREHDSDGHKFCKMEIVGPKVSEDTAKKWEEESIEKYRKSTGKKPKYNKKTS